MKLCNDDDNNNMLRIMANNKKQKNNFSVAILLIFSMGFLVGLVPYVVSYPFPIGYDVVNYYIPVTANFDQHWSKISIQFPLYAYLLHLINITTGLSPYQSVIILASIMSGVFAISLFLLSTKLLNLSIEYSLFLSVFVIFQVAVLRTIWDLHRDLFTLSLMSLIFSLIYGKSGKDKEAEKEVELKDKEKQSGKLVSIRRQLQKHIIIRYLNFKSIPFIASLTLLSALTSSADRMTGGLFTISIVIYSFAVVRTKVSILCASIALFFFITAAVPSYNVIINGIFQEQELTTTLKSPIIKSSSLISSNINDIDNNYNPINLLVLFIVITGLLLPTGIIGIKELFKSKNVLIIPLTITIILSFSWILFPYKESLVADRWIILSGVFLSIFSGYGLINLVQRIKIVSNNNSLLIKKYAKKIILLSVIAIFIVIGIIYEVMPTTQAFVIYGITHKNIGSFMPLTMQINSVDIKDNQKLLSSVSWINNHTEHNAIIIGEKHWRGFMELYLRGNRTFYFSDNLYSLINQLTLKNDVPMYLVKISDYKNGNTKSNNDLLFSANPFSVYKVEHH
jgi:hypothetical protein